MRSSAPRELLGFLAALAAGGTTLLLTSLARAADDPGRLPAVVETRAPVPEKGNGAEDTGVREAGIGVNGGLVLLRLSADRAVRVFGGSMANQVADQAPSAIAAYDLNETLFELAPTVHLGGDGFYFKLEAPLRQSATLRGYGVGVYPLNYGLYLPSLRIMPTFSAGGVFSYMQDRRSDAAGPLIETRVALGIKFFPTRGLALSADIARTPWALGAVHGSGPNWWQRADARGGIGDGWGLGLGVSWL